MAEGPIYRKTIQQNLVNYISHNLGRKADNEKEWKKKNQTVKVVLRKELKQTELVQIVYPVQTGKKQVHKDKVHPAHKVQLPSLCRADKHLVNKTPLRSGTILQAILYQQKVTHCPAWKRQINPKKG